MGHGAQGEIRREDAEQLIRFLCWVAHVPEPSSVTWLTRAVRGQYLCPVPRKLPRGRIVVGPRIRDGLAAVIHETAHHVIAMRQPRLSVAEYEAQRRRERTPISGDYFTGWKRGRRPAHVHHGPVFVETLQELARAWYGDARLYPWETEYRSLRAAGRPKE